MGPKLRNLVEQQLLADLFYYGVPNKNLKFDWSDSNIEGHNADYLDGSLENFASIYIYDEQDNLFAEGWMEFILGDELIIYWDNLNIWNNHTEKYQEVKSFGVPDHIWILLPEKLKIELEKEKIKKSI